MEQYISHLLSMGQQCYNHGFFFFNQILKFKPKSAPAYEQSDFHPVFKPVGEARGLISSSFLYSLCFKVYFV